MRFVPKNVHFYRCVFYSSRCKVSKEVSSCVPLSDRLASYKTHSCFNIHVVCSSFAPDCLFSVTVIKKTIVVVDVAATATACCCYVQNLNVEVSMNICFHSHSVASSIY